MSKIITFKYPTHLGLVEAEGVIALLPVGPDKHRCVIHDGYKLSDYRSGMLICCFDHIKIRRMAQISHHVRTSDRRAAEIALAETIERVGLEKFQAIVAAAAPLNEVKK
jgi:hypothetical protein